MSLDACGTEGGSFNIPGVPYHEESTVYCMVA